MKCRTAALAGCAALVWVGAMSAADAETPPVSKYDKAVQDRLAGRNAQAIAEFHDLSVLTPKDADVWLNLGLAYTAGGDFKAAEAALAQGLAIAPGYADMRVAYARVAYFRGNRAEAHARLDPLLIAGAPTNGDAQELSKQLIAADLAASADPWRADLTASYSRLSQGLAPWREVDVALSRRLSAGTTLGVDFEQTSRFSQANSYLSAQLTQRIGSASVFVGFGGSPDATYRAEAFVQGGVISPSARLGRGWTLSGEFDGSWGRYMTGDVSSYQPLVTLAHGEAFSVSARYIDTVVGGNQNLTGYIIRADAAVTRRLHVNAAYGSAPDSSSGITIREKTLSGGATFAFSDQTSLRVNVAHETTPHYTLDEYDLGLTRRF